MIWHVEWRETCSSTHEILKQKILDDGVPNGFVLATENQTQGHGRKNRFWEAPIGNLSFDFVISVSEHWPVYQLNLLTAWVLRNCLQNHAPHLPFFVKWPNDIWCENRKMAGILGEFFAQRSQVLIGVGINLNSSQKDFSLPLQNQLVTLKDLLGQTVLPQKFLDGFLAEFAMAFSVFSKDGFAFFRESIERNLKFLHEPVMLRDDSQIFEQGFLRGIDTDGFLLIENNQKQIKRHMSGDLSLRR